MDFKSKDISWVGNIRQKFETLCVEVDDIMSEEPFKYVENQLLTAGANVKQFCSEFVQDVLPPFLGDSMKEADLFLEKNKNIDSVAYERSKVGFGEEPEQELCDENSLTHASLVEPVEGIHFDLSLKQNADIGMYERSDMGVEGNPAEENQFPSEIPVVIAPAEKDSRMVSLFCGVDQSNDEEGWDGQVNLTTPILVEVKGCNSYTEAGETSNLVNATADISNTLPLASSVIFVEFCERKVPDGGVTSLGDSLSVVSNKCSLAGFELCDEFTKSEERSDETSAEEVGNDHVVEPGMDTSQPFDELRLDESCVVIDSNQLCSDSDMEPKHLDYQKKVWEAYASKMKLAKEKECKQQASWCQDHDAGSNQQRGESSMPSLPTVNLEFPGHVFCESEWEVI